MSWDSTATKMPQESEWRFIWGGAWPYLKASRLLKPNPHCVCLGYGFCLTLALALGNRTTHPYENVKWGFPYLLSHSILWTLRGCYYWILFSLWRRTQTGGRGMAVSPTSAVVDVNVPTGFISKTVQTHTSVQRVILILLYTSRPFSSYCLAFYCHSINW